MLTAASKAESANGATALYLNVSIVKELISVTDVLNGDIIGQTDSSREEARSTHWKGQHNRKL